jgi:hypothetical protein
MGFTIGNRPIEAGKLGDLGIGKGEEQRSTEGVVGVGGGIDRGRETLMSASARRWSTGEGAAKAAAVGRVRRSGSGRRRGHCS